MRTTKITRQDFLRDRQGREFSDVLEDPATPFDTVIEFFNRRDQQHRMEESETLYRKAPLAAVVRDLESLPGVQGFLSTSDSQQKRRFEQSVAILVRMVMERLGWQVISHTKTVR
jgi:hypothetical protein